MCRRYRTKSIVRRLVVFSLLFVFSTALFGSLQPIIGQTRQLSLADILIALRSRKAEIDEKNRLLAEAVKDRGITFFLTPEIEKELDNTGARNELIAAIRAKATPPAPVEIRKTDPPKIEPAAQKPVPPPQDFAFFRDRATVSLKNGNIDTAVSDLGKALELKPLDVRTLLDRSQALVKLEKPASALADLEKVIEIDPKNPEAYFRRAQVYEQAGNFDRAVIDFDRASELDAANETAKSSAARIRKAMADATRKAETMSPPSAAAKPPAIFSVGALNSYATYLATPVYPSELRRMNVSGRVTVQIAIDEDGKLMSAQATEGPKPLRQAAEIAIRRSKFKPVMSGDVPVLASGFITFNFVNQ